MERYRQEFYDTMHAQPRDVQVSGILGAFYLLLRRFEDHQEDVVYQLLPTGDRFLDIGCGYGFLVLRATAKFEDVYGIDIAPRRIGWAQAKAEQEHPDSSRIHFFVANADG